MAEIVENSKKFKVIKVTRAEINNAFGSLGICDACNCSAWTGYYIAVLNSWYCESDYNRFLDASINHKSDHVVEEANFQHAKDLLKI